MPGNSECRSEQPAPRGEILVAVIFGADDSIRLVQKFGRDGDVQCTSLRRKIALTGPGR